MLRMCVALPTRPDLDECIPQCTEACLTRLYNDAATFVRHHHAHAQFDSQMFEDAWALALYTDESPIYRLVNGNLSVHGRVAHEMGCVAPLIKRIYAAAQRLGTPFAGQASRILFADNHAMRPQFDNFGEFFRTQKSINMFQFASFTRRTEAMSNFTEDERPKIIYRCANLEGYDISMFSRAK